jgi:hypothetical protein
LALIRQQIGVGVGAKTTGDPALQQRFFVRSTPWLLFKVKSDKSINPHLKINLHYLK